MSGLMPAPVLAYEGQLATPYILRTFPPTSANNKFPVPTIWVDTTAGIAYIAVAKPLGVMDWESISTTVAIDTIHTPDGNTVVPVANNVNFLNGTGMNITGAGDNITFNTTGTPWTDVTTTPYNLVINNAYTASAGGPVSFALPSVVPYGSMFSIINRNNGFVITQGLGQQIHGGNQYTTSGAGGSLASTAVGDTVTLICTVANTEFFVLNTIGNLLYT